MYTIETHYYTLKYLPNTLKYLIITKIALTYVIIPLPYSNILPYTFIYIEIVMKPLYSLPLHFVTLICYKNIMALIMVYLLKFDKKGIFQESHNSFWYVKHLSSLFTSWDTINYLLNLYMLISKNQHQPKGCHWSFERNMIFSKSRLLSKF
jgi:hypothetical protein